MLKEKIKSPLLSIVIPCYNDHKNVGRAVKSALEQSYSNKEVIVVDDGSNPITKAVLQKLKANAIELISHSRNQGTSAARNTGIKNAKGDFIMVLDSDDFFDPEFAEEAVLILDRRNDIKLVTCYMERFSEKSSIDILKTKPGDLADFLNYNLATGSSMFRKRDWDACGGYDEDMKSGFEDWEFFIRLLKEGGKSYVIPSVMYHYMLREDSRTITANNEKYSLLKYIYFKHKDLYTENYETFIVHLLNRLEYMEKKERRGVEKMEFKIGLAILEPLRKMKRVFQKA